MTFVHPWAIAVGVAAAAAPLVVHLLTRPRPQRLPLSTLRFVREAVHQRRARHLLRDLTILTLRTLAVLLLALAVARPQWGEQPLVSDRETGDAVRVVVLDVSQSMAATDRGIEALERGRTAAAGYVRYRPGLQANLMLAAAAPRSVFEGPSTNFDALRDELAACRPLPQRLDVPRTLDLVAEMLAPASPEDHRRRELVVISDFQRSTWAKADFARLPADTQIQLESVAPAAAPPNVAILRVDTRAQSSAPGSVQLQIDLGNYTPTPQQVHVEVAIGQATWRLKADCPPNRVTTLSEQIELRQTGWQAGEARLADVDDALAADNVRPFVVRIRPETVFALLTRQSASRRPSSSHYLECALQPETAANGKSAARVLRLDPAQADAAALGTADLILVDHPGKLADESIKLLASLVRRGRPLVYVAGELIDATNLKRLADAAGSGLQMPVEFAPPPPGQLRHNLFLTAVRREEPPFSVFGDDLTSILGQLRFAGGLSSRRLSRGLDDDVLATYNDGSACLVLTASDAGAVAVMNADLGESNLARNAAFVPLVDELVERLLDRGRVADRALCGETLVAHLPGEAGPAPGLKIVGPAADNGEHHYCGELRDEAVGVAWHWPAPDRPGVYQVQHDGVPVYALAVTVPAEESELQSLSPDVLRGRLAGGRAVYCRSATAESDRRDDFWKWFAALCAVCMLGELGVMLAFRD